MNIPPTNQRHPTDLNEVTAAETTRGLTLGDSVQQVSKILETNCKV